MKLVFAIFLVIFVIHGVRSQLNGPNRPQTISNIFQIPIQTLTAISNVAQNTRPIAEVVQRRRRPVQPRPVYVPQLSRAAMVAGLYPSSDGSFFRI